MENKILESNDGMTRAHIHYANDGSIRVQYYTQMGMMGEAFYEPKYKDQIEEITKDKLEGTKLIEG